MNTKPFETLILIAVLILAAFIFYNEVTPLLARAVDFQLPTNSARL